MFGNWRTDLSKSSLLVRFFNRGAALPRLRIVHITYNELGRVSENVCKLNTYKSFYLGQFNCQAIEGCITCSACQLCRRSILECMVNNAHLQSKPSDFASQENRDLQVKTALVVS
jgi:hypothetical protein